MKSKPLSWTFVIWWMVASLLGVGLGFSIATPLMIIGDAGVFDWRYYLLFGAAAGLVGAGASLGQYVALRRRAPVSALWILAGAVGLAVAVVAQELVLVLALLFLFPLITGGVQSALLRGKVPRTWLWLLVNLLAATLAFLLVTQVGVVEALLTYSLVTGLGMFWLLKNASKNG